MDRNGWAAYASGQWRISLGRRYDDQCYRSGTLWISDAASGPLEGSADCIRGVDTDVAYTYACGKDLWFYEFLNTDKAFLPSAPTSAFTHVGAGTNMIYVDPDHNLIIVARWIEGEAMNGLVERVLKSLEQN